ncbi:MAG: hypothetical protein MPN21_03150 [Thermoanaerobaculia bacterium]|nr:hypothetical protein [Thermoanaerobaculia bacterium]
MGKDDSRQAGSVRFLRRLFGPLLALLGGTTTVAAILLGFGFLAQSGLFGFAGLPRLASDPQNLVEAGAVAVVETVPLALMESRLLVAVSGLIVACVLIWLRETRFVRRFYRSPITFFACQIVVLGFAASTLGALIDTAQKGSPSGREIVRQAAREARQNSRANMELTSSWNFVQEEEAAWAATWRLTKPRPLAGILNRLAGEQATTETGGGSVWSSSLLGRPLRLSPQSRLAARELYGWLALTTLLLIPTAGIIAAWRRALPESPTSWSECRWVSSKSSPVQTTTSQEATSKWKKAAVSLSKWLLRPLTWIVRSPLDSLLLSSRFLVEPLILTSCVACLLLLPLGYGVLAESSIGREEVQVILRESNWQTGRSCLKDWDAAGRSSSPAKTPAPDGHSATQANDPSIALDTTLIKLNQPVRRCSARALQTLEESIIDYLHNLTSYLTQHPTDSEAQRALDKVKSSIDALLETATRLGCTGAYRRIWEFRPHPALMTTAPRAAEYFWDRWLELQDTSAVRFGYILSYPRGEEGFLTLLEPLADPVPPEPGRWDLRIIPMSCVENTLVLEDPTARHTEQVLNRIKLSAKDPSEREFRRLGLHPGTLEAVGFLVSHAAVPNEIRGGLTTRAGVLLRAFSRHEPIQSDVLLGELVRIASDPQFPRDHRRAAVTALRMAGDHQAASSLLKVVDILRFADSRESRSLENVLKELPEVITQAGFLLAELEKHGMEADLPTAVQISRHLEELLRTAILSDSSMLVSAACSVVPVKSQGLETHITSAIRSGIQKPDRALVLPCIQALGSAGQTKESRELLWTMVANRQLPEAYRYAALSSLYSRGIQEDSELLLGLFRDEQESLAHLFGRYIEDLDSDLAGPLLLADVAEGFRENTPKNTARLRRSGLGLLLLDSSEDGDNGMARRLAAMLDQSTAARSSTATSEVCRVLTELSLRNGLVAIESLDSQTQCRAEVEEMVDGFRRSAEEIARIEPGEDWKLIEEASQQLVNHMQGEGSPHIGLALKQLGQMIDGIDPRFRWRHYLGRMEEDQKGAISSQGTSQVGMPSEAEIEHDPFFRLLMRLSREPSIEDKDIAEMILVAAPESYPHDVHEIAFRLALRYELAFADNSAKGKLLTTLLRDGGPYVRTAAAYFLDQMPVSAVSPRILDCAEDTTLDESTRGQCLRSLALLASDSPIESRDIERLRQLLQPQFSTEILESACFAWREFTYRGITTSSDEVYHCELADDSSRSADRRYLENFGELASRELMRAGESEEREAIEGILVSIPGAFAEAIRDEKPATAGPGVDSGSSDDPGTQPP